MPEEDDELLELFGGASNEAPRQPPVAAAFGEHLCADLSIVYHRLHALTSLLTLSLDGCSSSSSSQQAASPESGGRR
jgi:hypothetical protein